MVDQSSRSSRAAGDEGAPLRAGQSHMGGQPLVAYPSRRPPARRTSWWARRGRASPDDGSHRRANHAASATTAICDCPAVEGYPIAKSEFDGIVEQMLMVAAAASKPTHWKRVEHWRFARDRGKRDPCVGAWRWTLALDLGIRRYWRWRLALTWGLHESWLSMVLS